MSHTTKRDGASDDIVKEVLSIFDKDMNADCGEFKMIREHTHKKCVEYLREYIEAVSRHSVEKALALLQKEHDAQLQEERAKFNAWVKQFEHDREKQLQEKIAQRDAEILNVIDKVAMERNEWVFARHLKQELLKVAPTTEDKA